jgi:hypothetical protein
MHAFLFKDAMNLGMTDKSQLAKELLKQAIKVSCSIATFLHVVDGGWMLSKLK